MLLPFFWGLPLLLGFHKMKYTCFHFNKNNFVLINSNPIKLNFLSSNFLPKFERLSLRDSSCPTPLLLLLTHFSWALCKYKAARWLTFKVTFLPTMSAPLHKLKNHLLESRWLFLLFNQRLIIVP